MDSEAHIDSIFEATRLQHASYWGALTKYVQCKSSPDPDVDCDCRSKSQEKVRYNLHSHFYFHKSVHNFKYKILGRRVHRLKKYKPDFLRAHFAKSVSAASVSFTALFAETERVARAHAKAGAATELLDLVRNRADTATPKALWVIYRNLSGDALLPRTPQPAFDPARIGKPRRSTLIRPAFSMSRSVSRQVVTALAQLPDWPDALQLPTDHAKQLRVANILVSALRRAMLPRVQITSIGSSKVRHCLVAQTHEWVHSFQLNTGVSPPNGVSDPSLAAQRPVPVCERTNETPHFRRAAARNLRESQLPRPSGRPLPLRLQRDPQAPRCSQFERHPYEGSRVAGRSLRDPCAWQMDSYFHVGAGPGRSGFGAPAYVGRKNAN